MSSGPRKLWTSISTAALCVGGDADVALRGHLHRVALVAEGGLLLLAEPLERDQVVLGGPLDDQRGDAELEHQARLGHLRRGERTQLQQVGQTHTDPEPPSESLRPGVDKLYGWRADMLAQSLPELSGVIDGLLAVLGGQGLVEDAGAVTYAGLIGSAVWVVTNLGRRCVFLLDSATA